MSLFALQDGRTSSCAAPRLGDGGHARRPCSRSSLFRAAPILRGCLFFLSRRATAICSSLPLVHISDNSPFSCPFFFPGKKAPRRKVAPVGSAPAGRLDSMPHRPLFSLFSLARPSRDPTSLSPVPCKREKNRGELGPQTHTHKKKQENKEERILPSIRKKTVTFFRAEKEGVRPLCAPVLRVWRKKKVRHR